MFLTPYNAVTPPVKIASLQSPGQTKLVNALGQYIQLQQASNRLQQIKDTGKNLNPILTAYLFGKTDSKGQHIPFTGKQDEVQDAMSRLFGYIQSLKKNDGLVSDPNIKFSFDDPDAVQWRAVQGLWADYHGLNPAILFVEIYSNARVNPVVEDSDAENWGTKWFKRFKLIQNNGRTEYTTYAEIAPELSYSSYLDPITGIPHRFCYMEWERPAVPGPVRLHLVGDEGNIYFNAFNWNGWPTPFLDLPGSFFLKIP